MNNFENCGYYVDEECTICGMGTDGEDTFCRYCKDNPNCYYKQLLKFKIENERLKEEIKEVKKYQYKQEYLEIEIETAKVNLDIGKEEAKHYLHEAYKFQKCLQEIKKILLQAMDVKSNAYNHFLKVEQAIDLITKAGSEG